MSLRLSIALLLVGACSLVALGVFWPSGAIDAARAVELDVAAKGAGDARSAGPLGVEGMETSSAKTVLGDSMQLSGGGRRELVSSPPANRGFTMDVTRRMHATVHFPKGTPDDEKCRVVLRVSPSVAPEELSGLGQVNEYWLMIATFPVRDGEEFDMPLPEGVRGVQIDVEGRYLFFEDDGVKLDESQWLRPIELKPRLGGWVTLKFVPPEGYSMPPLGLDFAAAELEGKRLVIVEDDRASPDGAVSSVQAVRDHSVTINRDMTSEVYAVNPRHVLRKEARWPRYKEEWESSPFAIPLDWEGRAEAGKHTELTVQLTKSSRLAGFVVGERGEPIPLAMVEVRSRSGRFEWQTSRAADDHGFFDLRGLSGDPVNLRVQKAGYQATVVGKSSLGTEMHVVLRNGPRVEGTVRLPGGQPVMGLKITLVNADEDAWPKTQSTFTDSLGHFEAPGHGAASYTLKARARVTPEGSAMPAEGGLASTVWQLEVPGVIPMYNNELGLEMQPE